MRLQSLLQHLQIPFSPLSPPRPHQPLQRVQTSCFQPQMSRSAPSTTLPAQPGVFSSKLKCIPVMGMGWIQAWSHRELSWPRPFRAKPLPASLNLPSASHYPWMKDAPRAMSWREKQLYGAKPSAANEKQVLCSQTADLWPWS